MLPAEGPRQSSHLTGARQHAGAAPKDKETWPLRAPQAHAASRSTASCIPRGYGQRLWKSQRPPRPTDIIYHQSPTAVQQAPHQAGAHPHHSHASRARATGSTSHRPRARQQMERSALPPPPSQGRRPARCQGDSTPQTHSQGNPRPTRGLHKGWGDNPLNTPPTPRAGHDPMRPTGGNNFFE